MTNATRFRVGQLIRFKIHQGYIKSYLDDSFACLGFVDGIIQVIEEQEGAAGFIKIKITSPIILTHNEFLRSGCHWQLSSCLKDAIILENNNE